MGRHLSILTRSAEERANLRGLKVLLVNPFYYPHDLRAEVHAKDDSAKHERGMNFGLLVVATVLSRAGADVEIIDLEGEASIWREALSGAMNRLSPAIVGLGTLSVYTFLPVVQILELVRELSRDVVTVVGGQNAQNVPRLLPAEKWHLLDYLVCGDGEEAILQIGRRVLHGTAIGLPGVHEIRSGRVDSEFTPKVELGDESCFLEYELYPAFRELWPVIEESRGCPFKCDFCANPLQGGAKIRFKDPARLLAETERIFRLYGEPAELPVVLMTAIFGVNPSITRDYFSMLSRTPMTPRFVASTRVDLEIDPYIDVIAPYFDQMHFGLETGSEESIGRMVKAKSPERYLRRAAAALKAYHDRGIHTGVNFIVGYLGEQEESVRGSIQFLEKHRQWIDSVWGGGLIAYPDSPFARHMEDYEARFGASFHRVSEFCDLLATYPVNPSKDLSYSRVQELAAEVHELFYDEQQFYHHYKWYVGPVAAGRGVRFTTREEFYKGFRVGFLKNAPDGSAVRAENTQPVGG